ncbi:MAG: hypothetical protein MUF14_03035 [Hyphomonadaceae bacterium]|nr:hypothetical protein [Hyphomonadaceae bacterium]
MTVFVRKQVRLVGAGLAVSLTLIGSGAFAQTAGGNTGATNAGVSAPWYERFTFGSEASQSAVPRAAPRSEVRVSPRSRWGVSFGVREEPSSTASRGRERARTDTSAGAFYELSPSVRVGGQVVVPNDAENAAWRNTEPRRRQPGLKVESAFRF